MATIIGQISIDEVSILEVSGDPSVSVGTPGPIGSLAIYGGNTWIKTGPLDTDWDQSTSNNASQILTNKTINSTSNSITLSGGLVDGGTPVLGDILRFNGSNWTNSSTGTQVSASSGVNFFLTRTASGISTYELMSQVPDIAGEVDESIVVNNQTLNFQNYIADTQIGATQLDAGIWTFSLYSYVSQSTGQSTLTVNVYKRTSGGTETLLFSVTSDDINDYLPTLYTLKTPQPAFSCNATDRLLFKIDATTTATSNKTIHLVHSGTAHWSYISTPLTTRHNNLMGLQGGTSAEYYHLQASEYTGTGTGTFVRTNSPNITTPTGIVKADVGLGNVDNTSDINKPISTATQNALDLKVNIKSLTNFIDGPAEGWASGMYRTITMGSVAPDSIAWWSDSTINKKKRVEAVYTRDSNQCATQVQWKLYDTNGTTVLATITDAIVYSGVVETSRTRTIA